MRADALAHLTDEVLLRDLNTLVSRDRATTADLLLHISEVDARRLYVPAGYSSMFAYCVEELRFSEDAAYSRIYIARATREFPAILDAVADGRLHLTAARLLVPYLTPENAGDLLSAAAAVRRKSEIEQLIARRFPSCEPLDPQSPIAPAPSWLAPQLVPEQVGADPTILSGANPAPRTVPSVPAPAAGSPRGRVEVSLERFHLHVRLGKRTHEKLQYAQALLSHSIPSGDVEQILDRALDALISRLEKRKFAATHRPRAGATPGPEPSRRPASPPGLRHRPEATRSRRYVPAHVRRAVWVRDEGRCTFVGDAGHRCRARRFLEFDHIDPIARGGAASVERIRLRCRAHNQYEAERVFGRAFMRVKRAVTRLAIGKESAGTEVRARVSPATATRVQGASAGQQEAPAP